MLWHERGVKERVVVARLLRNGQVDRLAVMLSGLCVVHCVASVVLLGVLSSAAMWLTNPLWHEVGLGLAIGFGGVALVGGAIAHGSVWPVVIGAIGLTTMTCALLIPHGPGEMVLTIVGVTLLAIAHLMNRRVVETAPGS